MLKKFFKKVISVFIYIKILLLYFFAVIISVFVKNKPFYKDLWLISERGRDARDNGYHFFKYLRQNQRSINCAYVICKNSPDFDRISKLGNVICTGSFTHYIAIVCSKIKISTHIMGYTPDAYRFGVIDRYLGLIRGKKVFLQHGIIYNDIPEIRYPLVKLDLFVCSTAQEYESLTKNYNYPDGIIKRIGLCRYDALLENHETKRKILIMPTWRYHLRRLDESEFCKSEYYKNFNALINDKRLHNLLEENDYELVLYLHYELQKFTHLFYGNNSRVKVLGMGNADVQELLMESALLITDYSSVFSDFAYMQKPLAYWTFDSELFYDEQYNRGYFSFKNDGYGPECKTKEEIIDYIESELENGMMVEKPYAERVRRTFTEFSTNHCENAFKAITNLIS